MLDTFRGLPVHVLVVHAVVVGVPLAAVLTALVAVLPRWRVRAWWVVGLDAVIVLLVLVARSSGHQLLARVGTTPAIKRHTDLGSRMIWFALALLLAAVLVAVWRKASAPLSAVLAGVAVAAALAATGWVAVTGEAGSSAVWKTIVANTNPAP